MATTRMIFFIILFWLQCIGISLCQKGKPMIINTYMYKYCHNQELSAIVTWTKISAQRDTDPWWPRYLRYFWWLIYTNAISSSKVLDLPYFTYKLCIHLISFSTHTLLTNIKGIIMIIIIHLITSLMKVARLKHLSENFDDKLTTYVA